MHTFFLYQVPFTNASPWPLNFLHISKAEGIMHLQLDNYLGIAHLVGYLFAVFGFCIILTFISWKSLCIDNTRILQRFQSKI